MMFFIGAPATLCIVGSARSVLHLGIGLALMGVFTSIYHPAGLAMLSHTVRERGRALGIQGMSGNFGLAFAPLIAGVLASRFSWRYAYYILSLPSFVTGVFFIPIMRSAESWEEVPHAKPVEDKSNPSRQRVPIQAVIVLYLAMSVVGFCYQGMTTMLPIYLDSKLLFSIEPEFQNDLDGEVISENFRRDFDNNGFPLLQKVAVSVKKAGKRWVITSGGDSYTIRKEVKKLKVYASTGRGKIFVTMILLVGMLGQYIGGHSSDRYRKTRLYMMFNVLSLPFMALVGLISGIPVILAAALFAMFHFAGQPVENSLVAQYTPSNLRSSGYGLKFVFAFGIGSTAAAFSGYIGEYFGLNSVFFALGGVIFLAIIVTSLLVIIAKEPAVEVKK